MNEECKKIVEGIIGDLRRFLRDGNLEGIWELVLTLEKEIQQ